MARQEIITLKCDIHNSEKCQGIETLTVGIGRDFYEIEMGTDCQSDATLAQVREFGRKVPTNVRAIGTAKSARAKAVGSAVDNEAVRAWCKANGISVKPRGRIAGNIIDAYRQNNPALVKLSGDNPIVQAQAAAFVEPKPDLVAQAAAKKAVPAQKATAAKKAPAKKAPAKAATA